MLPDPEQTETSGVLLLVEDDPDHAFLIRRQLAEHGPREHTLVHLTTAAEARDRLRTADVRCVILDLSLPDARGMEGLEALRAANPAVPIVVLTGLDSESVGLQALQSGAQDYLVKGQHAADVLSRSVRFAMERSRRQEAERDQELLGSRLAVREAQLSEAQRLAGLGSWEWDVSTGQVVWSHELMRMSGLFDVDGVGAFDDYLALVAPEDRRDVSRLFSPGKTSSSTVVVRHRMTARDGQVRWVLGHMTAIARDVGGRPMRVLGTMQDITEQKNAEDRLAHQALHDDLTGLVNRGVLLDRLERVLARARDDDSMVAVIFLDLDQFKWVNDSHSHSSGDRLLVEVARRLELVVRPSDTLARFGGDEFVVLCERLAEESELLDLIDRIMAALAEPFSLAEQDGQRLDGVTVTASLGVATAAPGATIAAELLVRDADIAMYRAKERGRARFEIFDEGMRDRATARLRTQHELRQGLARHELVVHYQPVVDLHSGRVLGSEALVRWQHPERGLLGPDAFIPQAEDTGLIVELGAAVLRDACLVTAQWNRSRVKPLTVAVNLSARQLADSALLDVVEAALTASQLPPYLLTLEVTETVLMGDPDASGLLLAQLRALGVGIAIDDFGTGYSSLAYLLALPLDVLKVDRTFVAAMSVDGAGLAIASAVVALANSLGLGVIAEGVETTSQRDRLAGLGVTTAQGWLWGKAVSSDDAWWAQETAAPPLLPQSGPPAEESFSTRSLDVPVDCEGQW